MAMDRFKELVVDALCGAGFDCPEFAQACTDQGLAKFTGNQHAERWEWDRDALGRRDIEDLQQLYAGIKERQALAKRPTQDAVRKFLKPLQVAANT